MSIFSDEPTEEERQEQLPQDNETPFRPADDATGSADGQDAGGAQDGGLDDTHQATDTNLQPEEQYDEGVSGAAEASEPNADSAVVGYDPAGGQEGSDQATDAVPPTDTEGEDIDGQEAGAPTEQGSQGDDMGASNEAGGDATGDSTEEEDEEEPRV